jgi:hypothetical protein
VIGLTAQQGVRTWGAVATVAPGVAVAQVGLAMAAAQACKAKVTHFKCGMHSSI